MNKKILISLLYLLILAGTAHAALRVTDLRTEQLKNPLGIDIRHPPSGLAYRIGRTKCDADRLSYSCSLLP